MTSGISQRKATQDNLRDQQTELSQQVRERTAKLMQTQRSLQLTNRALKVLSECNQILVRATDEDKFLHDVCHIIVESGGYLMVWIGLAQDDAHKSVRPVAQAGYEEGYLEKANITWADVERGRGPTGPAIRTGRSVICRNILTDPRFAPWREQARKRGYASSIAIPLLDNGHTFGALNIYAREADVFGSPEVRLLEELGADLVYGIKYLRAAVAQSQADEKIRSLAKFPNENPNPVLRIRGDGTVLYANKAALPLLKIWNCRENQILPQDMKCLIAQVLSAGTSREVELDCGGRVFTLSITPIKDTDYQNLYGFDITERKQAEQERGLLATAIEQVAESIAITNRDGVIQYVNPAFERITGYTKAEALGENLQILERRKHSDTFPGRIQEIIENGQVWKGRYPNKKKDGSQYEEEASITPLRNQAGEIVNYVSVTRDVTQEVRMEKQLQEAQKMEAIGTLAGGIAHDFNNILMAILGYTDLALHTLPQESEPSSHLQQVLKAGYRARDLAEQILAFSRQREEQKKPIQIAPIVKETLKLLRASLPSSIAIGQSIDPDLGSILADSTQIHQVLMNLCTNAAQAMRDKGGNLKIKLAAVELDRDFTARHLDAVPGQYVRLTVCDTGVGIAPELMERIFEPYFTTKKKDKGTGLGLAVVHGIVKEHGGIITAYSEPEQGSTFNVYLPVIAHSEDEAAGELAQEEPPPGGSEQILLVDDEKVLVDMLKTMLESLGYRVAARTSSIEALELFRTKPGGFDLIITDMTMPQMTGDKLATELLNIRPDVPVIICTGFSEKITEDRAKALGIRALVMKPVLRHHLAHTIRQVLIG